MSSKCELLFIGDSIIHQMLDKEVKKHKRSVGVLYTGKTV